MKILLAKRRALGDTVLLSATIELLRSSLPEAEITALVPEVFRGALEGHPGLHALWDYDEGFLSLMRRSRAARFDYFIQLHSSPGQRWLPLLSGARRKVFHAQNRETEQAYGKHPDALEWDAFLLRGVFGERVPARGGIPKIYLSEAERAWGSDFWRRHGVESRRVVFFGLGASRPTKRWLPEHFAALAELLRDRLELVPALVAGPGDEEQHFTGLVLDHLRARGMRPRSGGKGDFVHDAGLSVRELASALSVVRAYVGNDSGPKHVALAVGAPTFTFFGPEDPIEWHPYPREAHPVFFLPGLPCRREDSGRWCGIPVCVEEKHRCMRDLDPLEVFQELEMRLSK